MPQTATPAADVPATQWWERRRPRYNLALIAAIVSGYFAYVAVVSHFADVIGAPILDEDGTVVGNDIEFGGIAVIFQCCGASIGLLRQPILLSRRRCGARCPTRTGRHVSQVGVAGGRSVLVLPAVLNRLGALLVLPALV